MSVEFNEMNQAPIEKTVDSESQNSKENRKKIKELIQKIERDYRKCTNWKESVKPDDVERLDKYSVAKLNGMDRCQDIIAHCVENGGREVFEKMMSEEVDVETFCKTYGWQVM